MTPIFQLFLKSALLLGISVPGIALAQGQCQEAFTPRAELYGADYISFIQGRLGGREQAWVKALDRFLDKPIEEILIIDSVFRDTQAQSWFQKSINARWFFRVESIARTLDKTYMHQIDLSKIHRWEHLSVGERRALLVLAFKKWWWEVDSHQVIGFSRWTDATYIMSRYTTEPISQGRLDLRLHELLGSASQTRFLSSLLGYFRGELRILNSLKGNSEAQAVLRVTLQERIEFLQKARNEYQLKALSGELLNIQILRAGVLRKMIDRGRALSRSEMQEVARKMDLPERLITEMRWGQTGLGLIPNFNSFLNVSVDIALTTAVAYIIGQYYLESLESEGHFQGDFNDLIYIKPIEE